MSWTNWRAKARTCSTPSLSGPSCPAPGSSLWVSMQDVALLPWSTLPLLGGSMGTSLCSPLLLPPWRTALILLFPSLCRVGECPGPDRPEPGQAASPPSWQPPAAALPTLHQGAAHPHPAGAAGAGGDTGRTEVETGGPSVHMGSSTDGPGVSQVSGDPVVDSAALQFCARKVSAVSGDARKALDVCRSVCAPKPSGDRASLVPVSLYGFPAPGCQGCLLCLVLRAVPPQACRGGGGAGGARPDPAQATARG